MKPRYHFLLSLAHSPAVAILLGIMGVGIFTPFAAGQSKEFTELNDKYEAGIAKIESLSKQIQQIDQDLEAMLPALRTAAEKAYAATKGKNKDAERVLIQLVQRDFATDRFESAATGSKLLLSHGYREDTLWDLAGIAAYAINDYQVAKVCFEKAEEAKSLSDLAKFWSEELEKQELAWKEESRLRGEEQKADDLPRVEFETTKGKIVLELFENEAPLTVANFISLVEKEFYDGLVFHRVIQGFVAQGGCPNGDGSGDPGYAIPCECNLENHRKHFRGSISMAHRGRDTGGSQFYLTFVPTLHLNGKHTVFGRVIEGMEILSELTRVEPGPGAVDADKIIKAKVLRKRDHDYKPTRVSS